MADELEEILKNLHKTDGLPRLEISGVETPSDKASILNIFNPDRGEIAVYVLKDFYSYEGHGKHFDVDYVYFPKQKLKDLVRCAVRGSLTTESLFRCALATERRGMGFIVNGKHVIHYEHYNDYSGAESGSPEKEEDAKISLFFNFIKGKPALLVEHQGISLCEFNVGDIGLYIAHIGDQLLLKSYTHQISETPLDIPISYDDDQIGTVSETYDSRTLEFKEVDSREGSAILDISILTRCGYWYYGSLDDSIPPWENSGKKRLTVNKDETNNINYTLEDVK